MLSIIIGGQYGDEGKGKITSYLARTRNPMAVVRAGTGPNAGHTVKHEGKVYKLRLIPSGFTAENAVMLIGAGVVIKEDLFLQEIKNTGIEGRVFIDRHTGIITNEHIERENANAHLMGKIGSTGSGSGAANVDRVKRVLKVAKDYPSLEPFIIDVSERINSILDEGGDVIVEGSQATFLSVLHGSYPYTTSKDVCASAALSDIGVGPTRCSEVILVLKSYVTRVGAGKLKDELDPEEVERRGWQEYGTVTGRLRRAAPFDLDLAKKACQLNGATTIALTKVDILFPAMASKTDLQSLTPEVIEFITKIEDYTGVPVKYISTGPSSEELIIRDLN